MARVLRTVVRRSLLVAAAVLAAAAVAEIGLRVYLTTFATDWQFHRYASLEQLRARFGREGTLYSAHPYLGYYPTPGYEREGNRHNALGYRGDEIEVPKPPGRFRIACLGGSTTYTSMVRDHARSYPAQLQRELRDRGLDVDVVNAGVPGWTTWESLLSFELRVLELEPDLAIVYHALNDVPPRLVWPPEAYRADNSGFRARVGTDGAGPGFFEHSTLIRVLLIRAGWARSHADLDLFAGSAPTFRGDEFDQQMWSGTYPSGLFEEVSAQRMLDVNRPVHYRRNLEHLIAVAGRRGVAVVLATFAQLPPPSSGARSSYDTAEFATAIDEMNDLLAEIAAADRVELFDFAGVFPREPRYYQRYTRGGVERVDLFHVNAEGAALVARLFADFLVERNLVAR